MAAAYEEYIARSAEKIDEDARKAGVFEEVVTVTPSQMGTSAAITEWTHLAHLQAEEAARPPKRLSKGLDAATARVVPTRTSASATASDPRRCAISFARKSGRHCE